MLLLVAGGGGSVNAPAPMNDCPCARLTVCPANVNGPTAGNSAAAVFAEGFGN
jgi:hypothetical protein